MIIDTHSPRRIGPVLLLAAALWCSSFRDLQASSILIDGNGSSVVLTAADCTLDQIMSELHQKYNFEVVGLENVKASEVISLTVSDTLQNVLERLLPNWNHVIVNSSDDSSRVAKVMIINSNFGSAESQQAKTLPEQATATNPLPGHF